MFLRNSRAALTPHNVHRTFFGAAVLLHDAKLYVGGSLRKDNARGRARAFLIYLICPGEGISGRVRQQGRDVDTASLNQRDDLCLRSPHRKHYVGLRWGLL